jgi:hypothetical protein
MQKLLFLLFLGCLSANVWAQKIDTLALISEVLKTYTTPVFLDTLKTDNAEISEQVVFFIQENVQQNAIKNAYVWDKNTQSLAFMDMDLLEMSKQGEKYNVVPVNIVTQNNTVYLYFSTSSRMETIPIIYKKIDTLANGIIRETEIPFCPNAAILPNGETLITSPLMVRIIELPYAPCRITPNKTPINFIADAQFLYNKTTKKYEMQDFERQSERRDWFAQAYLVDKNVQKNKEIQKAKEYREYVKKYRRPCH